MTRETYEVLQALEYVGLDNSQYSFIDAYTGTDARVLFPTSDDVELKGYCLCIWIDKETEYKSSSLPQTWSYIITTASAKIYIYSLK